MSRKALIDIKNGFKNGVLIGLFYAVFMSFVLSGSKFAPGPLSFYDKFPNELIAFLTAIILWGSVGIIFALTSHIFTDTDWSISKMTIVHALLSYVLLLPIAIFLEWIRSPINKLGLIIFTTIYILIYIIMWYIWMKITKKEIDEINSKI